MQVPPKKQQPAKVGDWLWPGVLQGTEAEGKTTVEPEIMVAGEVSVPEEAEEGIEEREENEMFEVERHWHGPSAGCQAA